MNRIAKDPVRVMMVHPGLISEGGNAMKLWHDTDDTPRLPEKVQHGQVIELWVGTYPIEPGQHVKVEWDVKHADESSERGTLPALWRYNDFALGSSYWLVSVGPFQQGDKVKYSIVGTCGASAIASQAFEFTVDRGS